MKVKKGDKVTVEYEGKLNDGTIFDSSKKHGQPLEFTVGEGRVIKGFDNAVKGMSKGEEKEVKIEAKDAYGNLNLQLIQKVPKDKLSQDQEVKEGMVFVVGLPNGQKIPARVTEVADEEITLDLNHPLAGKTLNFKIKVVEVQS